MAFFGAAYVVKLFWLATQAKDIPIDDTDEPSGGWS
jgi:hypothetical protein